MSEVAAAFLVALSIWAWTSPGAAASRAARLRRRPEPTVPPESEPRRQLNVLLVSALSGLAAAVTLGRPAGIVGGLLAAVAVAYGLLRLEPRLVRVRRERMAQELPLAADLLAACLRAGQSPDRAVQLVGHAIPGPLGAELALVGEALRLGARPELAWSRLLEDPVLAPFARALVRTWDSGAPLADILTHLAADARRTLRSHSDRRARSVGVKAALPLGLCFLPAFILVGVVPLVASAITDLLQ